MEYFRNKENGNKEKLREAKKFAIHLLTSLVSWVADTGIYAACFYVLTHFTSLPAAFIGTIVARIGSTALSFFLKRALVFEKNGQLGMSLVRFFVLAGGIMLLSAGANSWLVALFQVKTTVVAAVLKSGVDAILYFLNYYIQKKWVFTK